MLAGASSRSAGAADPKLFVQQPPRRVLRENID
jgi:hypothetical protein